MEQIGLRLLGMLLLKDRSALSDELRTAKPCSSGRLLHYVSASGTASGGVGPHTDYEALTLVWQSAPGLETWSPEQGWERPVTELDELLVFPGDSAELLTGGRVEAVLHRVEVEAGERWSFVVFVAPDFHSECGSFGSGDGYHNDVVIGEHIAACICAGHEHLRQATDGARLGSLAESGDGGGNPIAARLRREAET